MGNPAARNGKPVIFVVILFLAVAIIYSPFSTSAVFAVKPARGWLTAVGCYGATCCWSENSGIDSVVERYCQTCWWIGGEWECDEKVKQETVRGGEDVIPPVEEGVAPPPPPGPGQSGPGNVLPEGVMEEPEIAPTPGGPEGLTPQVDCVQNPNDPLCGTATIPEAVEQPEEQQSTEDGDGSSGDGGNENNDNSE